MSTAKLSKLEPPPSVAVLKRLLQIGGADTRHKQKTPAGLFNSVHPVYAVKRQVFLMKKLAVACNHCRPRRKA